MTKREAIQQALPIVEEAVKLCDDPRPAAAVRIVRCWLDDPTGNSAETRQIFSNEAYASMDEDAPSSVRNATWAACFLAQAACDNLINEKDEDARAAKECQRAIQYAHMASRAA